MTAAHRADGPAIVGRDLAKVYGLNARTAARVLASEDPAAAAAAARATSAPTT